jgi:hypothetical protein
MYRTSLWVGVHPRTMWWSAPLSEVQNCPQDYKIF